MKLLIKAMYGQNSLQSYVERRLTALHHTSAESCTNYKEKVLSFVTAAVVLFLLPYLHIGVFYKEIWVPDKPKIDRKSCTCSCFDTIFRGSYEQPGKSNYKHVYFNATWQSCRIWIFTVVFVLLAYESIKYVIPLFRRKNIRWSMFFLYIVNVYPHYYSWWSYFSYYNEDFYNYFLHHMLFTVTEIIATCLVLNLCDLRNEVVSWKIFAIVSINLMHILVGGMDQFIEHVLLRGGTNFQNARNIGLMIPDLLHVVIPMWSLFKTAKEKDMKISEMCYKEEILLCFVFVSLATLFGRIL